MRLALANDNSNENHCSYMILYNHNFHIRKMAESLLKRRRPQRVLRRIYSITRNMFYIENLRLDMDLRFSFKSAGNY